MNSIRNIGYIALLICMGSIQNMQSGSVDTLLSAFQDYKKFPETAWNAIKGMGGMVGALPDSYYYNFRLWNDSPAEVLIGVQGMLNISGIKVNGDYHTFAGIAAREDFHNYILCPPFFNTGTLGYKTLLVMQMYLSLFQDSPGTFYPASFQAFDTQNKARIARNKKFGLGADDLIEKKILEYSLSEMQTKESKSESNAGQSSDSSRRLRKQYLNDLFAQQMLKATNEDGFIKNNIIPNDKGETSGIENSYEHGDATVENDENVYVYHAYRDKTGVKGEFLQWGGTVKVPGQTAEFAGTFYVSSAQKDLFMTFYKDGVSYTVALEPGSFNLLQSTEGKAESMRPAAKNQFIEKFGFQFYQGDPAKGARNIAYVPLASVGPAYVYDTRTDAEVKKGDPIKPLLGGPRPYTYELYDVQGKVGLACHSLRVGQAPLPATSGKAQIRDINPVNCHIWVQSAEVVMNNNSKDAAAKKQPVDYSSIPFDVPEQVWIAYQTKDATVIQKLADGMNESKIVRPRLSEELARLYICSVATADDSKAQQFMKRLASGAIALPASHQEVSDIQKIDIPATIQKMQPSTYGIIVDINGAGATGVSSSLLVTDVFTPNGLGNADRYYYVVPPQLNVSILAGMLPLEKEVKDVAMQEFSKQIVDWIRMYQKQGKDAVVQAVTQYLQQFGVKELFVDQNASQAERILTAQAKKMVERYVVGSISVSNPPLIRQAGMSYPFPGKPSDWPATITKPA